MFLCPFDEVLVCEPAEVPGHGGITHLHGDGAVAVEVGRTRRGAAGGVVVRLVVAGRRGPRAALANVRRGSSALAVSSLVSLWMSLIARCISSIWTFQASPTAYQESASVNAQVFWMSCAAPAGWRPRG